MSMTILRLFVPVALALANLFALEIRYALEDSGLNALFPTLLFYSSNMVTWITPDSRYGSAISLKPNEA